MELKPGRSPLRGTADYAFCEPGRAVCSPQQPIAGGFICLPPSQAYALLLLALALCASAHGGYYYGGESHRRLQAKSGFGRELLVSGRHLRNASCSATGSLFCICCDAYHLQPRSKPMFGMMPLSLSTC